MIIVLAGTRDAADLVHRITAQSLPVLVSTATGHGAAPYREQGIPVRSGRLDRDGLAELLWRREARLLVDATHPHAAEAHREAADAAEKAGIPCVRFERPPLIPDSSPRLYWVNHAREAAEKAAALKGTVLLTTGSKQLDIFAKRLLPEKGVRLVVRLLPTVDNLRRCRSLGIDPSDVIALQGPFGASLNRAFYDHFAVDVLITKESGGLPWVEEKVNSALNRGIRVVIIRRPAPVKGVPCSFDPEEVVRLAWEASGGSR
ncbi:precorrin-6A reductase [Paludifilum halophilum]|nr:precorrin-6A reductase [Paludifilum halophilum]